VDTILFDLDGTLVDSTEPILGSLNTAFHRHGLAPLDRTEISRFIGPPLREVLTEHVNVSNGDLRLVDRLIDSYRGVYVQTSLDLALAYPGIPELIDRLAGHVRLGVVTSKPRRFAVPILETLALTPYLEVIEGPRSGEEEQKPATLTRALAELGLAPGRPGVWMIGDRHHDVRAGRPLGLGAIGVTWGFGTPDELMGAGADHLVDRPEQLGAPSGRGEPPIRDNSVR
jgi:phosphoglycolate phosphatase